MPYKERTKTGLPRKTDKPKYKITNWSQYNESLRKRGMISLYFPGGDLESLFINTQPYVEGESGRTTTYQVPYIQLIYTLYRLFGFGQRQITGYFEYLWRGKSLEIPVPSFGHLCDLFSQIPLEVKQFCNKLAGLIKNGEAISLILDSTGLRFNTASNWYAMKYNKICKNKPWQKMHISMDPEMNIHDVEITDCHTADIELLESLIPENISVDRVIADGAYYSIAGVEKLSNRGITPVIPTPRNAKIYGQDNTIWHDKVVGYIGKKGNIYAFYKKYCYGIRALIEAQISRIKRCIGDTLLTKKISSQKREAIVITNIINLWNSFGKCVAVKIG